jgi:hypothetical protein
VNDRDYRISGHESFPCRYTWLPKAVRALAADVKLFSDEEKAMIELGVGKNMVRSIRFWAQAMGIATASAKGGGNSLTEIGRLLLGKVGLDPFLEDIRTLWILHWNLATHVEYPLLAWDYLMNRWQEPELVPSAALRALEKETSNQSKDVSRTTLEQHFDVFLHTYFPTRGRKGQVQEDNLDCPLIELELFVKVGDREIDRSSGKREPIYAFCRDDKPDVTPEVFLYCVHDFWQKRHKNESTIPLREVAHGYGSPGQVFKLPEEAVRSRIEALVQTDVFFAYNESASIQQLRKKHDVDATKLLKTVYSIEEEYV